jgi:hypothetical protein
MVRVTGMGRAIWLGSKLGLSQDGSGQSMGRVKAWVESRWVGSKDWSGNMVRVKAWVGQDGSGQNG